MPENSFRSQFAQMVRGRRATRRYAPEPLPAEEVNEFLDLVLQAPSAFNIQDRSIVVVEDPEVRAKVVAAAHGQNQVATAPLLLVILGEPTGARSTFPQVAEQNVESGLWTADYARERVERFASFQKGRSEAELREGALRNASLAAGFALLTAEAFGWSSSPMTGYDEQELKAAIGAGDSDVLVALLLAVGKPGEHPAPSGRLPLERRVYRNVYGG